MNQAVVNQIINQLNASHIDYNIDKQLPKNARAVNKLDMHNNFIKFYNSLTQASDDIGQSVSNISYCCSHPHLSCGGFKWEYANESL
jgi:hypothetical protein